MVVARNCIKFAFVAAGSTFGHNLAAAAILAAAVHYEITRSATPVNNGSKPKTTRFKLGSDLELPQCIVNEKFSLKI